MSTTYTVPGHWNTTMAGDEKQRAARDAQAPSPSVRQTAEGITITDYDPATAPTAKEILRRR